MPKANNSSKITSPSKKNLEFANKIVSESKHIVIFSGAGISTESGIPDFRSETGLWRRFDPEIYANYAVFLKHPEKYWEMERVLTPMVDNAVPNPAHFACVTLEEQGRLSAIITQNIDCLHQRAGLQSTPVYELHGSHENIHCLDCNASYTHQMVLEKMEKDIVPRCDICGGLIKSSVVLFHERMPSSVMTEAESMIENNCDCFVCVGSSLQVSPANEFPFLAKRAGAKIIFVNLDPTEFDDIADVVICGKAGEILPQLVQLG